MKFYLIVAFLALNLFSAQENLFKDVFEIARKGRLEDITTLHRNFKDSINAVNNSGYSVLILACYNNNKEVAEYLIENVKNINYASELGTALTATIFKNNVLLSEKLLKKGANPNITDKTGITPLMYAVQFQNINTVELLLNYNADKSLKNNQNKTAFEIAIETQNQEIINKLKSQ